MIDPRTNDIYVYNIYITYMWQSGNKYKPPKQKERKQARNRHTLKTKTKICLFHTLGWAGCHEERKVKVKVKVRVKVKKKNTFH
jgi:hypothetical protein